MAGTKKLRVLLKGGWAFGVEADQYVPQKRSGNYGSDVALMSFTKRGDEVCAVLLSELAAIAEEGEVWMQPQRLAEPASRGLVTATRRRPARSNGKARSNGNGVRKRR